MVLKFVSSPSPNFNERLHPLDMLVLHYTGMKDGPTALARMRDPVAEVSAHYMVEEDGTVHVLVEEDKRAWHAGKSRWQADGDLNSRSIGIEIVNGGHDFGLPEFPDVQIEAVIELCQAILGRWPIPQSRIVAHSDIAPGRKEDPGERFPWQRLAQEGIGLWPDRSRLVADMDNRQHHAQALLEIGYDRTILMHQCVQAFQRRWRPEDVTGEVDGETAILLHAVAELIK